MQPGGVLHADVTVVDGVITAIDEAEEGADAAATTTSSITREDTTRIIDASGAWVLPGLIDIHCDAIEKEVEPRPSTLFPLDMAFLQFERKLAAHGITTMLHSLSLGVGLSLRGEHLVTEMVELISSLSQERAMIRHGVHLRYEVSHLTGFELAQRFISEGHIDLMSLMDHAPGQGQYHRPGAFERYVMKNQGVGLEEVAAIVRELADRRDRVDWGQLISLTTAARGYGIAVASHDDDNSASVERSLQFGASVSEFPLSLDTAAYATRKGMSVCVGAPNIVRGGSHDGNLNAINAVKQGAAGILCSDYHPASLLQAVFIMEAEGVPLEKAVAMATLNPAVILGRADKVGSIAIGKLADMIVVRKIRGNPLVQTTIVNGTVVNETHDYFTTDRTS